MRYTKENLEPAIKSSVSFADVLRKFNLRQNGGTQANIKRRTIEFGIDFSHFLGQGTNRGEHHKGGNKKLHWKEILVLSRRPGHKEHANRLREALIESGVLYKCYLCGQEPIWRGRALVLPVDHKNGNNQDNRKSNIRFLCPNCHSQTDNFGVKNIGANA
jgi:predicted RNA-binding Zn-ribbon protein involved in translation (DUF1610 family)